MNDNVGTREPGWVPLTYRDIDQSAGLLDPDQEIVLRLRFGRPGVTPLTLREASSVLGCSRATIRASESEGMALLRRLRAGRGHELSDADRGSR